MSELSRVEDLLKTGVEEPVLPMSRLEAILRGEKITPQSRVEELLLQYNPSDILIEKRITANGTYFAVNDNADGYFKVVVDTPVTPSVVLDHLVETITENGTYTYTPEHDGFEDAEVTVNVQPSVGTKTITTNGTYNASDEVETYRTPLSYAKINANSFGHNSDDIREKGHDIQYLKSFRLYCRASSSSGTDEEYIVNVSNIPTFTPTQLSDKESMLLVASYESDTKQLYVSKDESGFWVLLVGDIFFSRTKTMAIWEEPKGWAGYSQVTVNVPSGNTASIQVECKNLDNETVTITSFDESETYTEAVSGSDDTIIFNNLTYSGVWYVTNSANQDVVEIDNSVVIGEVVNGTDLMPYIDQIRINDYGSAGTLTNNVFTFNVSENRGDWSSNVIVNNTTAIDLTNIDRINVDVTVTSQVDYGYVYILFSDTAYTWGGSQWPSLMYNVDAAIKIDSSGRYTIDTSNISGNQYIYLAATTGKVSVTKGDCDNSKSGTIIGSITGLIGYGSTSGGEPINANNVQIATTEHTFITNDLDIPMSSTGNGWYLLGVSGYANGEYQEHYFPFYWNGSDMDVETWQYPSGYSWRSYVHITDTTVGIPTDYNGDWRNQYAQITKLEAHQLCNDNS